MPKIQHDQSSIGSRFYRMTRKALDIGTMLFAQQAA
jgi:hypothetical protein